MMNAEKCEKPLDIQVRAKRYALRVVAVYRHLKKERDDIGLILGKQYLRAAASIGANLVEAQSGESRRDFIHKCSVSQKEARECKYWLTLPMESETVPPRRLALLMDETERLIAILTRIIVNAKRSQG